MAQEATSVIVGGGRRRGRRYRVEMELCVEDFTGSQSPAWLPVTAAGSFTRCPPSFGPSAAGSRP